MNVRQVRQKIKSVTNVRKITKAMQLVSAIKMKKAQQLALDGKPYQENLDSIIKEITIKIDQNISNLLTTPEKAEDKELGIVISTNKGLCGSYNFNLFRFIFKNSDFIKSDYVAVGKKAAMFINKIGGKIIADYSSINPVNAVSAIFDLSLKFFLEKKYKKITIFYNRFISTLRYEPTKETIIPISFNGTSESSIKEIKKDYLIEPSANEILDQLLRSFIEEKIRNIFIQNEAGEHSARMLSMKNATENANDVIYNLTLLRNKIRQEKITSELLDMITAKESVESNK